MRGKRKLGICIAAILGLTVALYLGGLLGQMLDGYALWLQYDGFSGNSPSISINTDVFFCIGSSITSENGLKGTLFVITGAGALVLYFVLHNRFSRGNEDERNFKRSSRGTYGTAGWMSPKELNEVLELSSAHATDGSILGTVGSRVVSLPADTLLNKHVLVIGASGTKKSRAYVRPYLLQCLKRGESVILTDPKSELFSDTADLFRQHGYIIRVFNLVTPQYSDSWNCMGDLRSDTLMAQILADVIIQNTSQGKGEHFWDSGESNLLKALVLQVDADSSRSHATKNLPAVYDTLTQNDENRLSSAFARLGMQHPANASYNLFRQASDTVRAGIILGLGTRLQVLQSEAVRKITSNTDIDLCEPARSKCIYYVILSDQDGSLDFLSSLFFSFLFIRLVRYADATPSRMCDIPVNCVFDEFNNIGSIPDYPRRLSTIRSRNISVSMVVQNLAQLQNRYPNNLWAEIAGNADIQLMLGCTDELTADFISKRTGDMTVEVNSTMTNRQTLAVAQVIPQYRYTESLGRRRLMTPDEVLRLPNDQALLMLRGHNVLKVGKFDFTAHPLAKHMIRTQIQDYQPQSGYLPTAASNTPPIEESETRTSHETKRNSFLVRNRPPNF